jgi:YD repeat-containing protein
LTAPRILPELLRLCNALAPSPQLSSATDGEGNLTAYSYDGFDRIKRTTYPNKVTKGQTDPNDFEELQLR